MGPGHGAQDPCLEPRWEFRADNVKVKGKHSKAEPCPHSQFCLFITSTNINSNPSFLAHIEQKGETVK